MLPSNEHLAESAHRPNIRWCRAGEGRPPRPTAGHLQTLLTDGPTPLTRQELLARWPGDPPRPDTLWRTLVRGIERCLFTISGNGTKTDPFRYGLASRTEPSDRAAG